ncbi:hypothetical protein [Nonomuraea typhae]|uniref:Uncharacterized protein n=1 Tax=Nonomuraea typhae TaxID=2603600 RepID=A0ABW7YJB1_9ACTN
MSNTDAAKLTPTKVDDRADREQIGDAETRMGIKDMDYNVMRDGTRYYVRRNAGEMLWAVYTDQANAPVGYLAATYSDTRALKLEVWDGTGQPFAYGSPDNLMMLTKGLARLHDYLSETGKR